MKRDIQTLLIVLLIALIVLIVKTINGTVIWGTPEPAPQPEQTSIEATTTAPTTTTTATVEPNEGPHYALTTWERDLVERVVMAEAGGEPFDGQVAVAQCILNAAQRDRLRPSQVVEEFKYTKARPEPTEEVKQAVSAVFDDGYKLFDREVVYFYAPALVTSVWHESQDYVATIGCHKFFKEAR